MDEYKAPYLLLFRAVSRALEALERQDAARARQLLIRGQQAAEEAFLAWPEQDDAFPC